MSEMERSDAFVGMRAVYAHYYPPFWAPIVETLHHQKSRVALHVQLFYQSTSREFQFDFAAGAREAVAQADMIMVSQDHDVKLLEEQLGIERNRIRVMPKSVPPRALEQARAIRRGEITSGWERLFKAPRGSAVRLLYLGRP